MAYTPIGWQTGDTITAEKLNKMDNGWSVSSSFSTICDETVTTYLEDDLNVANLTVSGPIESDVIIVTYDNDVYTCNNDDGMYGAPFEDFSEYPFTIFSPGDMICETAGTHTVKIDAATTTVETTTAFSDAVASIAPVFQITLNKTTWQQAHDAMASGKLCYYTAFAEGDEVEQFVALQTIYDTEQERYEINAVGVPTDSLAVRDVIYAFSSDSALLRD